MDFFCWWWLRSPGNNQNNAANVNNDGSVNYNGNNVNNDNDCIRPALSHSCAKVTAGAASGARDKGAGFPPEISGKYMLTGNPYARQLSGFHGKEYRAQAFFPTVSNSINKQRYNFYLFVNS